MLVRVGEVDLVAVVVVANLAVGVENSNNYRSWPVSGPRSPLLL